ncbi:MAG: adenylate/guanylate cyclase domain-containing protein [Gaiellaceae bacterium]
MAEARKTVTIIFADVAGSTALGERLDPEAVRALMDRYFAAARAALERHGGTLEKFIGDAVVAVFGIPQAHEDDALRAVRAAWELRSALAGLAPHGACLAVRIGVNTGEVVSGDHSTGQTFATGDAVNVAARLEQAAEPGEILLGEPTYRLVRDAVRAERVEPLELKGKSAAVAAWRLLDLVEGAPAFARRFDTPFVGRGDELRRLGKAFERSTAENAPVLFTVLGHAGIGKTRLAAELVVSLGERARVLQGRCLSYGEGITFWPLQEILRALPTRPADAPDPDEARSIEETFWAYRKLFEALARERPLVLVLEDIHWGEPALLDLVEHVVEWTRDAPVLLLCLARPELLDERPGWPGERLELAPLADDEAREFTEALAEALDPETRARVAEAAEGNPLFLEQMLALAGEEDGASLAVPPTVQALLAARLDRLDSDERVLLECAAVVGKEFWRGALVELSPSGTEVSALVQRLVRRRLVHPERASFPGEDGFRFGHVLIRDAAYEAIPKARRAELHERFADWLEARESPYAEIVGHHLEQAYRFRAELGLASSEERALGLRAARTLASAGHAALERGHAADAVSLLSRALDLLPEDDAARSELELTLARALDPIGDWERALGLYDAVLERARAKGDRGLEWTAIVERNFAEAIVAPEVGSNARYLREAESAAAFFGEVGDEQRLARAWHSIAVFCGWSGSWARGADAAERAAELARRAGDRHQERLSLSWLTLALVSGPAPVREVLRRLEAIFPLLGEDLDYHSSMLRGMSEAQAMLGNVEAARSLHERAVALVEELGLKRRIASTDVPFQALSEALGTEETERKLRRAFALFDEMGDRGILSTVAARLAMTLYAQGRYDEAETYVAVSEETVGAADDYLTQSLLRSVRARLLARHGRFEEAEVAGREALAIADSTDDLDLSGWLRLDLAEVLELAGKPAEAADLLHEAVALARRRDEVILVDRAEARLAALRVSS